MACQYSAKYCHTCAGYYTYNNNRVAARGLYSNTLTLSRPFRKQSGNWNQEHSIYSRSEGGRYCGTSPGGGSDGVFVYSNDAAEAAANEPLTPSTLTPQPPPAPEGEMTRQKISFVLEKKSRGGGGGVRSRPRGGKAYCAQLTR